jgi:hypothetical protein
MRQVAAQIDPRVLAFAALLALVSGLLFGIGPAYRAARLDLPALSAARGEEPRRPTEASSGSARRS